MDFNTTQEMQSAGLGYDEFARPVDSFLEKPFVTTKNTTTVQPAQAAAANTYGGFNDFQLASLLQQEMVVDSGPVGQQNTPIPYYESNMQVDKSFQLNDTQVQTVPFGALPMKGVQTTATSLPMEGVQTTTTTTFEYTTTSEYTATSGYMNPQYLTNPSVSFSSVSVSSAMPVFDSIMTDVPAPVIPGQPSRPSFTNNATEDAKMNGNVNYFIRLGLNHCSETQPTASSANIIPGNGNPLPLVQDWAQALLPPQNIGSAPSRSTSESESSTSTFPQRSTTRVAKKLRTKWGADVPNYKVVIGPKVRAVTAEEKFQRACERKLRNRRTAEKSREKKEQRLLDLEAAVKAKEESEARLKENITRLTEELAALKLMFSQ